MTPANGRTEPTVRPLAEREHYTDDEYADAIRADYRRGRRRWATGGHIPNDSIVINYGAGLPPGTPPQSIAQMVDLGIRRAERLRIW